VAAHCRPATRGGSPPTGARSGACLPGLSGAEARGAGHALPSWKPCGTHDLPDEDELEAAQHEQRMAALRGDARHVSEIHQKIEALESN